MATQKQILKFIPTQNAKINVDQWDNEEFHIQHLELEKGPDYYDPFTEWDGCEYQNPNFDINVKPEYKIINEEWFKKDFHKYTTKWFWKKHRFNFHHHIVLINSESNHIVTAGLTNQYPRFGSEGRQFYDIRRYKLLPKMIYKMYEVLKEGYYATFIDLDGYYQMDIAAFANTKK